MMVNKADIEMQAQWSIEHQSVSLARLGDMSICNPLNQQIQMRTNIAIIVVETFHSCFGKKTMDPTNDMCYCVIGHRYYWLR
jgi:hypothetical protein